MRELLKRSPAASMWNLVVTVASLCVGFGVLLSSLGLVHFESHKKRVSSLEAELLEVGSWNHQSDVVAVVDLLYF